MNQRLSIVGALIATVGLPAIGNAQADKLLCDATAMLAQSRMCICTAQCLRRAAMTAAREGNITDPPDPGCTDPSGSCKQRYDIAMTRIQQPGDVGMGKRGQDFAFSEEASI